MLSARNLVVLFAACLTSGVAAAQNATGSLISRKPTSVVPCWLPSKAVTSPVTGNELTQPPAQMPPVTSSSTRHHASPSGTSRAWRKPTVGALRTTSESGALPMRTIAPAGKT